MKTQNPMRRLGSVALAAAVGACSLLGFATAANAATGDFDPDELGSITIHKFEKPLHEDYVAEYGDGTEIPADPAWFPLEGVEFTVKQVDTIDGDAIDLATAGSWNLIAKYFDESAPATFDPSDATFGTSATVATGSDGIAEFADLPVGLYWVEETANHGQNNVNIPMESFLVTVPLAGPSAGAWNFDIHVYPKNDTFAAVKRVDHSDTFGLGSSVKWSVEARIPVDGIIANDEFSIVDNLPTGLVLDSASLKVVDHTNADVTSTFVSSDYNITEGQTSTLEFTADGVAKLSALRDGKVYFNLDTHVESFTTGTLTNSAVVTIGDVYSDTVTRDTTWGEVDITKFAAENAGDSYVLGAKLLSGAKFEVYPSEADALAKTNIINVTLAGATELTTDVNGAAVIDGLYTGKSYWLVETTAPVGYIALSDPIEFTVAPGFDNDLEVANLAVNAAGPGGNLPVLGGSGMIAATIAGALVIATGIVLLVSGRRKKATN